MFVPDLDHDKTDCLKPLGACVQWVKGRGRALGAQKQTNKVEMTGNTTYPTSCGMSFCLQVP